MDNARQRTPEEEAAWRCTEPPNPQEGMDTFSRNHPASWRRHDPANKRVEQHEIAASLYEVWKRIRLSDPHLATLLHDAAGALNHATYAEGHWEHRARNAERELRNYTGDRHAIGRDAECTPNTQS